MRLPRQDPIKRAVGLARKYAEGGIVKNISIRPSGATEWPQEGEEAQSFADPSPATQESAPTVDYANTASYSADPDPWIANVGKSILGGFDNLIGAPSRTMQANPYAPGSEEAGYYDTMKANNAYGWGPEMATAMIGTGGPLSMLSNEARLGVAGGKLPQPAPTPAPVWYSQLGKAVDESGLRSAPAEQWLGWLRNKPGIKQEELNWMGLEPWLKEQKGPVTKEALQDYVRAHQVELNDVTKGGERPTTYSVSSTGGNIQDAPPRADFTTRADAESELARRQSNAPSSFHNMAELPTAESRPKFEGYQVPGGQNYRELLLTLPSKGPKGLVMREGETAIDALNRQHAENPQFKSSHWEEPNVLAHVRMNDRVMPGPDGTPKKTLFLEEVQSDWHQKGRKQGYRQEPPNPLSPDEKTELKALHHDYDVARGEIDPQKINRMVDLQNRLPSDGGVPDAPFKTTWPELAMKRMIRHAAENGYDQVAWTPGNVQAARYPEELRRAVSNIGWSQPAADGIKYVHAKPRDSAMPMVFSVNKDGLIIEASNNAAKGKDIHEVFGKDMAEKIMGKPEGDIDSKDFVIGAKGMEGFYDQMLPSVANKIGKKFGAKVEQGNVVADKEGWHITPPERTTHGKWMVKSSDYNSKGLRFDTEAEAKAALAERLGRQQAHVLPITPAMRDAVLNHGFPLFKRGGRIAPNTLRYIAKAKRR